MKKIDWSICCWAVCAFPLFLAGCTDFGDYGNSFGRLDNTPRHKPASIQVSAPQLYKREALINERRKELDYLGEQLELSKTVSIKPELVRDIEVITAVSARLGLSFDAGLKQQIGKTTELSDIQQQISVLELRDKLAQLERDVELRKATYAVQAMPSASAVASTTPAPIPGGTATSLPDLTELKALVTTLTSRLDTTSIAPRAVSTANIGSPIEELRDRQALRRNLQASINEASLDDTHDFDGHSLFRMQFNATVLPGDVEVDKSLGVLRMKIRGPKLAKNDPEVKNLYLEWLDHVTLRLNNINNNVAAKTDPMLLMLGSTNDIFSVVWLMVQKPDLESDQICKEEFSGVEKPKNLDLKKCLLIPIALPLSGLQSTDNNQVGINKTPNRTTFVVSAGTETTDTVVKTETTDTVVKTETTDTVVKTESEAGKFCASSNRLKLLAGRIVSDSEVFSSDQKSELASRISKLVDNITIKVKPSEEAKECKNETATKNNYLKNFDVPELFFNSLFEVENLGKEKQKEVKKAQVDQKNLKDDEVPNGVQYQALGRPSAYAVTPAELAQHISSAARAGNAVQIAASLAALLPAQGIGGNGALGYSRAAIGKVDAMERVPLVVGYAESDTKSDNGFGWLLGPKVIFDPQNKALALEHNLAPYSLMADVVIPGWWPYFEIQYQSEWAPDWQNKRVSTFLTEESAMSTMRVPRRHSRGDLDGITMLAFKQLGTPRAEIATISRVEPKIISGCAEKTTLLVEGTNIWRTDIAYLAGLPSSEIKVLPDMAGIAVTFDMTKLPRRPSMFIEPVLTLLTPYGSVSAKIGIHGSRLDENSCGKEVWAKPGAPDENKPSITSVLPSILYACDSRQRILVQGKNLKRAKIVAIYLGTIRVTDYKDLGNDLEVTINRNIGNTGGSQATLPLIITTINGTVSQDVKIERNGTCAATVEEEQLVLHPVPAGRLDVCAKKATLLLTGGNVMKVERATLTMKKPRAVTINAQSVKSVNGQNVAEIQFVGLPTQEATDSSMVDETVEVRLFQGNTEITSEPIPVEAVCGGGKIRIN
ncbi:MAG: hypothetical protein ABL869_13750 [Candidatus Nitrotoga sp.]